MIYGIGHDVLEIKRVTTIMNGSHGQRFIDRILTPAEREIAQTKGAKLYEFVAGRFALKEAISKAFGCGIGAILSFIDIEIVPDASGKPTVTLSAQAWERLGLQYQAEYYQMHVSISHQTELASAFAVIEKIEFIH
ncbi:holo-ACP synthase [Paenibacillus sp. PsM32]|uniref:holo-ACP synthase n=1 Tax=unclassified Paenibacillus TaxID=185978 RepID=UPI0023667C3F|nr:MULTISPECIES: holo-ACP synthase [unclassified Paenibacillus]MDN4619347.1 holo-ACP synthase [Paenibacillus sp. PsM32]WDF50410.1 holo-ACP synthase [Paenibacillus sp. KACC 21273]